MALHFVFGAEFRLQEPNFGFRLQGRISASGLNLGFRAEFRLQEPNFGFRAEFRLQRPNFVFGADFVFGAEFRLQGPNLGFRAEFRLQGPNFVIGAEFRLQGLITSGPNFVFKFRLRISSSPPPPPPEKGTHFPGSLNVSSFFLEQCVLAWCLSSCCDSSHLNELAGKCWAFPPGRNLTRAIKGIHRG